MEQFYMQDSRGYVGNDVLWWAKDGNGYTTDLSKAEVYSREDAQRMHDNRRSDVPWPKSYIDGKTRPAVDMQYINRDEALEGAGVVLRPEPKPKKETINCGSCGSFMSEQQLWASGCPRCGADNRP